MAQTGNNKLKVLRIYQMLMEESDEQGGLTMADIIGRLEAEGIKAERKSVYRDIDALRSAGIEVQTYPKAPVQYGIPNRPLSVDEITMIADAISAIKAIPEDTSNDLINKLMKAAARRRDREYINKVVHVHGRPKGTNPELFEVLNVIHEALRNDQKMQFKYFHINYQHERVFTEHGNAERTDTYEVSPLFVSFENGYYYLTAALKGREQIVREFRCDRMIDPVMIEERCAFGVRAENVKNHYQEEEYFGRFDGERKNVRFLVNADKIEILFDRFGPHITPRPYKGDEGSLEHVVVSQHVRISPQFFGWVASMGDVLNLIGPKQVVKDYEAYLDALKENLHTYNPNIFGDVNDEDFDDAESDEDTLDTSEA